MEENGDQKDGMRVDEKVDELAMVGDRNRTDGSEDKDEDGKGETCDVNHSGGGKSDSIVSRSEEKDGDQQTEGVVAAGTGSGDADRPSGAVSGEADRPTGTASTMSAPQQGENEEGDDGTGGTEEEDGGYEIDVPGEKFVWYCIRNR